MRVIRETLPGSSHARNVALGAVRGDIVLFTDDDAIVHTGWIDALCRAFEPDVAAVGGRVLPQLTGPRPVWMPDFEGTPLTLWDHGPTPFEMQPGSLPFGVNMAVRRAAIAHMREPFNTNLGHRPGLSLGFEETHLLLQLASRHRVVYTPDAVVDHIVEPERLSLAALRRSFFQNGVGRARHERLRDDRLDALSDRTDEALRASFRVAVAHWRNRDNEASIDVLSASSDLYAHMRLGRAIEGLVGARPRVGDWFARHLI
jgi:hypothetical protein